MKLTIAKLACKALTLDAEFCKEISLFGTLSIPEDDPIYKETQKNSFDARLEGKGIDPILFWKKFDDFLQTDRCKEDYGFSYNPALPAWEQSWQPL